MPAAFATILILHGGFASGSVTRQVARPEDTIDMLLLRDRDQIDRSKPGRQQSAMGRLAQCPNSASRFPSATTP
jgi:hypothetical protein